MPVDRGGDAPIAPSPVGVHSGDNSMITILEAGIYRVDLIRRDQGLIEQIAALLGAEGRIGRCYFGDHAQRAGNRFQQIRARPEIIESTFDRVNIEFTTVFSYHIWWL